MDIEWSVHELDGSWSGWTDVRLRLPTPRRTYFTSFAVSDYRCRDIFAEALKAQARLLEAAGAD